MSVPFLSVVGFVALGCVALLEIKARLEQRRARSIIVRRTLFRYFSSFED